MKLQRLPQEIISYLRPFLTFSSANDLMVAGIPVPSVPLEVIIASIDELNKLGCILDPLKIDQLFVEILFQPEKFRRNSQIFFPETHREQIFIAPEDSFELHLKYVTKLRLRLDTYDFFNPRKSDSVDFLMYNVIRMFPNVKHLGLENQVEMRRFQINSLDALCTYGFRNLETLHMNGIMLPDFQVKEKEPTGIMELVHDSDEDEDFYRPIEREKCESVINLFLPNLKYLFFEAERNYPVVTFIECEKLISVRLANVTFKKAIGIKNVQEIWLAGCIIFAEAFIERPEERRICEPNEGATVSLDSLEELHLLACELEDESVHRDLNQQPEFQLNPDDRSGFNLNPSQYSTLDLSALKTLQLFRQQNDQSERGYFNVKSTAFVVRLPKSMNILVLELQSNFSLSVVPLILASAPTSISALSLGSYTGAILPEKAIDLLPSFTNLKALALRPEEQHLALRPDQFQNLEGWGPQGLMDEFRDSRWSGLSADEWLFKRGYYYLFSLGTASGDIRTLEGKTQFCNSVFNEWDNWDEIHNPHVYGEAADDDDDFRMVW